MNDRATIKRLEELTASERAFAAARKAGSKIDQEILNKLASDKQKLTGTNLNLDESDQDALARRQSWKIIKHTERKSLIKKMDFEMGLFLQQDQKKAKVPVKILWLHIHQLLKTSWIVSLHHN